MMTNQILSQMQRILLTQMVHDSTCCSRLIDFAASIDDDPCDETWLPPREAKRLAQRKARLGHYKKGPDVGSKFLKPMSMCYQYNLIHGIGIGASIVIVKFQKNLR